MVLEISWTPNILLKGIITVFLVFFRSGTRGIWTCDHWTFRHVIWPLSHWCMFIANCLKHMMRNGYIKITISGWPPHPEMHCSIVIINAVNDATPHIQMKKVLVMWNTFAFSPIVPAWPAFSDPRIPRRPCLKSCSWTDTGSSSRLPQM